VAKKFQSQTRAFVGPFDDSRDIGDYKRRVLAEGNDSQLGDQGGEGVVGDLRAGGGNFGDKRGFSRIRETDDAHIGQELEFQAEPTFLPGPAGLGMAGRLAGGRGEAGVPASSPSPPGGAESFPGAGEILQEIPGLSFPD